MINGVDVIGMLLGGLAAGMVLFIVSVGLSVTMGLMGFANLAHGSFAMLGGYVIVLSMHRLGLGFASSRSSAFRWNAYSTGGSTGRPNSTRCCSPSASCSC